MTNAWFWCIVAAGTVFLLWFTWWASVQEKRYHGIYRFFAFESNFILILLNFPVWFKDPFSPVQIVSWLILLLSIWMVAQGTYLLKSRGKSTGKLENTTRLIEQSLYAYIRHPLYASLLYLGWGAFLKSPESMAGLNLAAINTIALWATAKVEEREMLKKFGQAYAEYKKRTKNFIPWVF
jgi:protein-S-isoprenylcysteine O-methyltransferase Ste14